MRVPGAGLSARRRGEAKHPGCQATSAGGVMTQRAETGSDGGRHSRLISP
jgi:hypothetical protein